ncbi:RDD family protein [Acetobacteraceae bacterium B3987]|nr:RDD family protein [Acetobacteraceae bacterium B3987]
MTIHPLSSFPKADIWARLIARIIDLALYTFCLSLPVYGFIHGLETLFPALKIIGTLTPGFTLPIMNAAIAELLFILPLSMVLDALIGAYYGNTLGKYLLGIRPLRTDGRKLDLCTCLKRNYLIYVTCYTGGIYFLTPLAEIIHYIRYKRTGTTFWDQEMDTMVLSPKGSTSRTIIVAVIWFFASIPLSMLEDKLFQHFLADTSSPPAILKETAPK